MHLAKSVGVNVVVNGVRSNRWSWKEFKMGISNS